MILTEVKHHIFYILTNGLDWLILFAYYFMIIYSLIVNLVSCSIQAWQSWVFRWAQLIILTSILNILNNELLTLTSSLSITTMLFLSGEVTIIFLHSWFCFEFFILSLILINLDCSNSVVGSSMRSCQASLNKSLSLLLWIMISMILLASDLKQVINNYVYFISLKNIFDLSPNLRLILVSFSFLTSESIEKLSLMFSFVIIKLSLFVSRFLFSTLLISFLINPFRFLTLSITSLSESRGVELLREFLTKL